MRRNSKIPLTGAALLALVLLALPSVLSASTIEITEESYIANPAGEQVVIMFDLFKQREKIRALPPVERDAAVKALSRDVAAHYLSSLPKAEAATITSAVVAIVYIPKRNEYNNPDLASLQQLAIAKFSIADGKPAAAVELTGAMQY